MEFFWIYIAAISLISVIACYCDKKAAKRKKRRISEKTLLTLSLLGGAVAMYAMMRIIRHKTRHNKFMIGLPLIILLQIAALILIYLKIF